MAGEVLKVYRISEELRKDIFGTLYSGEHLPTGSKVLIRVFSKELTHDPLFAKRFSHEQSRFIPLRHPNLLQIHTMDIQEENYFIAYDYPNGKPLSEYLKENPKLSESEQLRYIHQTERGVSYLQQHGITHGYIRPESIWIQADNQVKLCDFGFGSILGIPAWSKALLSPNARYKEYLAPEELQSPEPTMQSDIYSMGVLLYEISTGLAYPASFHPEIEKGRIPAGVYPIIARAVQSEPSSRYSSLDELATAIGSWANKGSAGVTKSLLKEIESERIAVPSKELSKDEIRRNRNRVLFSGTVFLIIALVAILGGISHWLEGRKSKPVQTSATEKPVLPRVIGEIPFDTAIPNESKPKVTKKEEPEEEEMKIPEEKGRSKVGILTIPTEESSYYVTPIQKYAESGGTESGRPNRQEKTESRKTESGEGVLDPVVTVPPGMIFVQGGNFPIGTDSGPANERPQHIVQISSFYIDRFEVTNSQYAAFLAQTGHGKPSYWPNNNPPAGQENFPVTQISWSDAQAFAQWIGKRLFVII